MGHRAAEEDEARGEFGSGSGEFTQLPTRAADTDRMDLNELTGEIVDAALMIHRAVGPGFLECVYEEAMSIELGLRKLLFARQPTYDIFYREQCIGTHRPDLLVDGRVVVELKAVTALAPVHTAQLLSYLRISRAPVGLLINFNVRLLREGIRRVVAPRD